jgi:hypothetical protein
VSDLAAIAAELRLGRGQAGPPPAVRAIDAVLARLELEGIPATRDAGGFFPRGLGILVGLPTLTSRQLAARTYTVPVRIISSDPLNTAGAVDALYLLADELAAILDVDAYYPHEWSGGVNRDALPAVLLETTVTIAER